MWHVTGKRLTSEQLAKELNCNDDGMMVSAGAGPALSKTHPQLTQLLQGFLSVHTEK